VKGIAHFSSGVAAASFFPWSVQAAAEGNPLYFIIGGAFALLPDTADFKFYRFFYRHHVQVEVDPRRPDPQGMAEKIAGAIGRALAEKKTIRVKLNSLRLGADSWRQYKVKFDAAAREVRVHIGPIVSTGQVPIPATEPGLPDGRAPLPGPVQMTYDDFNQVDIFDGPTVGFEPDGKGGVIQHFLPWHRNWSHSLVMGALFGAVGALIWDWRVAVVIFAGNAAHVLEDQMGLMGSNLFFPLTRRRTTGMKLMRSGDALPNFAAVWLSCLFIFWNVARYSPPSYLTAGLTFWNILLFGAIVPAAIVVFLFWLLKRLGQVEPKLTDDLDEDSDALSS
jgi:membrane-bound metal-dependent hydrolase YbcI (DUF457 family)